MDYNWMSVSRERISVTPWQGFGAFILPFPEFAALTPGSIPSRLRRFELHDLSLLSARCSGFATTAKGDRVCFSLRSYS